MDNNIINGCFVFILGMVVVFVGMIVIVLAVQICGKLMGQQSPTEKKEEKLVEVQPVAEAEPQAEEIPAYVKAAIIATISAYYFNSQSKCDFVVKKIKRF